MLYQKNLCSWTLKVLTLLLGLLAPYTVANAAQTTLTWTDSSTNEEGFRIERRIGTSGSYQQLASVASNTTTYADINLANSTTYCYRLLAFNAAGNSAYSNENCATTPTPLTTFTVTVSRTGTGSGTVSSSVAGISCGTDCSEAYANGTIVALTATAAAGSVFGGWSGTADCTDGSVTVNANLNCTATFNLAPSASYTLTTSIVNEITASGTAGGKVLSNPVGIDCGSDCSETYPSGQVITLTPVPAANSKFTGWTGDGDCTDGSVTVNAAKTCTARFGLNVVTVSVAKKGKGRVAGTGIDCGSACSATLAAGGALSLSASADAGFVFSGWSGGCSGTGNCTLTPSSNTTVTASFSNLGDKIGVYRPSTGEWFLDRNGSGAWEGCSVDLCAQPFSGSNAVPVVGDWNGSGTEKLGLFVPASSQWFLDANGNGIWDGCGIDVCSQSFGQPTDIPTVGRWTTTAEDRIAMFRPGEKKWHLDLNGNENLDSCKIDRCATLSVYQSGDLPVAGDWTGRGTTQVGLFRPSTGEWFLDSNANRTWNRCTKDLCIASFGASGDVAVSGDWNGTGISKIGVYRPATSEWFLDLNGNGKWDGPSLDLYVPGYGQTGDIPVIGKW